MRFTYSHFVRLAVLVFTLATGDYSSADVLLHLPLNEISGTRAADEGDYASNGTYVNGVSLGQTGVREGSGDYAAHFDGSNDYVVVPNARHLNWSSGGLTLMAWVNADTHADYAGVIVKGGDGVTWPGAANYSLMIMSSGKLKFAAGSYYNGSRVVSLGSWHHVAVTYDGSRVTMYIDGQRDVQYSATLTPKTNGDDLFVGVNKAGSDVYFDGLIDDVRLFNQALTATEINTIYQAALDTDELIAHWSFDDLLGSVASDLVGTNHGSIYGYYDWQARCNNDGLLHLKDGLGYVNVPADESLDFAGDATIAGWFKLDEEYNSERRATQIVCEKYQSDAYNMHVALAGNDYNEKNVPPGTLVFKINGGSGAFRYTWTTNTRWLSDEWYHFAVTVNAESPTNNKVYVNGVNNTAGSTGQTARNDLNYSADFNMGGKRAESISGERYLEGAIDDFRLYSYQLTSSEIADLYGLILHWKLDEIEGLTAADSSGRGLDGTASGVTFAEGEVDGAYEFDGSSSRIDHPTVGNQLNGLQAVTVMMWVKSDKVDEDRGLFITASPSGNDDRLGMRYDKDGFSGGGERLIKASISTSSGNENIESSDNTQTSQWQHLALVWKSGESLLLYIDGELDKLSYDSGALKGTLNNVDFLRLGIGAKSRDWDGLMDDFRIYNRALCGDEIKRIHGGGEPPGVRILEWVEIR